MKGNSALLTCKFPPLLVAIDSFSLYQRCCLRIFSLNKNAAFLTSKPANCQFFSKTNSLVYDTSMPLCTFAYTSVIPSFASVFIFPIYLCPLYGFFVIFYFSHLFIWTRNSLYANIFLWYSFFSSLLCVFKIKTFSGRISFNKWAQLRMLLLLLLLFSSSNLSLMINLKTKYCNKWAALITLVDFLKNSQIIFDWLCLVTGVNSCINNFKCWYYSPVFCQVTII